MTLTRKDRQSMGICLYATIPESSEPVWVTSLNGLERLCFTQPIGELSAFDPTSWTFVGIVPTSRVLQPDLFPTQEWVHVAIVMAPDGEARLLLEGHEVADPDFRWVINIHGRAADTQLFVRDLVLWEGMRY